MRNATVIRGESVLGGFFFCPVEAQNEAGEEEESAIGVRWFDLMCTCV